VPADVVGRGVAMITLAIAQMIFFFYLQAPFTGGEDGIQSVPRGRMFGVLDLSQSMSTDRLIFDSDQTSNLNNFSFTGFGAGTAVQFNLGGGYYEVVAPVPEPSTIVPGALAFIVLGIWHVRRCRRGLAAHVAKRPR
jgi:ABC-type branched-subunit amino acid transport system permease subunit